MLVVHSQKLVKVADLNPVGYNPRKITPEKYEALKENIRSEGFIEPLVVQKDGMKIIGGHQRLRAWKELSIEECVQPADLPCIILDVDDTRAKKLNIKMNNLKGDFEARMLGELLLDIFEEPKIDAEDALALGFDTGEDALKFMHLIEPPNLPKESDDAEPKTFAKSVTLSLEFDSVDERNRVKKILATRTEVEKKKTGDIVAALLTPTPTAKMKTRGAKKSKKRAA